MEGIRYIETSLWLLCEEPTVEGQESKQRETFAKAWVRSWWLQYWASRGGGTWLGCICDSDVDTRKGTADVKK